MSALVPFSEMYLDMIGIGTRMKEKWLLNNKVMINEEICIEVIALCCLKNHTAGMQVLYGWYA